MLWKQALTCPLTVGKRILLRWHLFLIPLWLLLTVEYLNRDNVISVYDWGISELAPLFLNYLIVLGFYLLLTAAFGRTRWAYWTLSVILLAVSLISGVKYKLWAAPLFPWDPRYSTDFPDIVRAVPRMADRSMIIGMVVFIVVSCVVVHAIPWINRRARWPERAGLGAAALLLLYCLYTDKPFSFSEHYPVATTPWDPAGSYMTNGYLLSAMIDLDVMRVGKPAGYGKERIAQIIGGSTESPVSSVAEPLAAVSPSNPNIIVVLSESFWDPTVIKGVTFSRDPIPFLHSLQQTYSSGWMLSPQFGGGTANVEFEVLTGNSMRFLPDGSIAYIDYVNRGVDSLASILARQGYVSTAINPYYNWFFTSRKVYRNFGFGKFISSEYFPPSYEGLFLSDNEVARQIIGQTERSQGPDFVFANTMENHWPYYPGKFKENTIQVSGDFSDDTKGMLETYAQGISGADRMLETLVNHYAAIDEPTIVVFFGDHLPSLGDNNEVYTDTKYISGDDDPDYLQKMYRTPIIVWNNFLPQHKDDLYISPSFLGPYVLHQAGKKGSYYTDYLYGLSQRVPVIPPQSDWETMHINESDLTDYEQLEHDILFGGRYGYQMKELAGHIVNPGFHVGYDNPMVLEDVTPAQIEIGSEAYNPTNGGTAIKASGQNFAPSSVIVADGKPLPTTFVNSGTLTAAIPEPLYRFPGTINISVEVIDEKHVVLSRSNAMQVVVD